MTFYWALRLQQALTFFLISPMSNFTASRRHFFTRSQERSLMSTFCKLPPFFLPWQPIQHVFLQTYHPLPSNCLFRFGVCPVVSRQRQVIWVSAYKILGVISIVRRHHRHQALFQGPSRWRLEHLCNYCYYYCATTRWACSFTSRNDLPPKTFWWKCRAGTGST